MVYCAPMRRPFESIARPAACSESSTSVVIFPLGSNLTTPPLAVAMKLPSGNPTPASEPRSPEATISIFVPAFTMPGISGVTLSVAGGCAASCAPRPPSLPAPRPPSRPWRPCACASSDVQQIRQVIVNREALDAMPSSSARRVGCGRAATIPPAAFMFKRTNCRASARIPRQTSTDSVRGRDLGFR